MDQIDCSDKCEWLREVYPKKRRQLPPEYEAIYKEEYRHNRSSKGTVAGIVARLEQWMHRKVAMPPQTSPLLELGAGTLNHVPWEDAVDLYDIVEPFVDLYRDTPYVRRIRHFYPDISDIPPESSYARIISVAVLEHVLDLPALVARACLLLKDSGRFVAGIPSEGGLLWYFAWRFGTGLDFWIRRRLTYGVLMRHEHVNTAKEIVAVLNVFFTRVSVDRFPLPLLHGSFYTLIEAKIPRKDLATHFLSENPGFVKRLTP
ncbi:MAG: class I SAM-dependent methyltransferase [Syntrophales bacterium]